MTTCDSCEIRDPHKKTTSCIKDPFHEDKNHGTNTTCDLCERNLSRN